MCVDEKSAEQTTISIARRPDSFVADLVILDILRLVQTVYEHKGAFKRIQLRVLAKSDGFVFAVRAWQKSSCEVIDFILPNFRA